VIVTGAEVEIRYVIPTSTSGEHARFCHLRTNYLPSNAEQDDIRGIVPPFEERGGMLHEYTRRLELREHEVWIIAERLFLQHCPSEGTGKSPRGEDLTSKNGANDELGDSLSQ